MDHKITFFIVLFGFIGCSNQFSKTKKHNEIVSYKMYQNDYNGEPVSDYYKEAVESFKSNVWEVKFKEKVSLEWFLAITNQTAEWSTYQQNLAKEIWETVLLQVIEDFLKVENQDFFKKSDQTDARIAMNDIFQVEMALPSVYSHFGTNSPKTIEYLSKMDAQIDLYLACYKSALESEDSYNKGVACLRELTSASIRFQKDML